MKKFVRINENYFALQEEPKAPLPSHPKGQLQNAVQQLNNFISMLGMYHEEGLDTLARDMVQMAHEIKTHKPIETYWDIISRKNVLGIYVFPRPVTTK